MTAAPAAARPAGFWRRYTAYSLDFAVLAAAATALSWSGLVAAWSETVAAWHGLTDLLGRRLADGLMQGMPADGVAQAMLADRGVVAGAAGVQGGIAHLLLPWLLWYALLAAIYHVAFEQSRWRASPGKHALQLSVVDAVHDRTPAVGRTVLRHAACALSWLTFNLGHASAAVPPHKRALHDYIAGTRVLEVGGGARLPVWARCWLLAQVVAGIAAMAWVLQRYAIALQSAASG